MSNLFFIDMSRAYDGWPTVVGMDTRAFKTARESCSCESETVWLGAIVYKRSESDFLKVKKPWKGPKYVIIWFR